MAQAQPTICAHGYAQQALVPGVPVRCRGCGTIIEPTPRAVNSGGQLVPSEKAVNAIYPADSKTADSTWAFSQ